MFKNRIAKKVIGISLCLVVRLSTNLTAYAVPRFGGALYTESTERFTPEDYAIAVTYPSGDFVELFFNENGDLRGRQARPNGSGYFNRDLIRSGEVYYPNWFNGGRADPDNPFTLHFADGRVIRVYSPLSPGEMVASSTGTIVQPPPQEEVRSSITIPNRLMTGDELNAWIEEYQELGGITAFELEVVDIINAERARYGLHPLTISHELSMAARFKSQKMYDLRYFGHRSPVLQGMPHGYRDTMFGHRNIQDGFFGTWENLSGRHYPTPESVVNAWMNSPGHRAAIMLEDALTVGIGRFDTLTTARFGF